MGVIDLWSFDLNSNSSTLTELKSTTMTQWRVTQCRVKMAYIETTVLDWRYKNFGTVYRRFTTLHGFVCYPEMLKDRAFSKYLWSLSHIYSNSAVIHIFFCSPGHRHIRTHHLTPSEPFEHSKFYENPDSVVSRCCTSKFLVRISSLLWRITSYSENHSRCCTSIRVAWNVRSLPNSRCSNRAHSTYLLSFRCL